MSRINTLNQIAINDPEKTSFLCASLANKEYYKETPEYWMYKRYCGHRQKTFLKSNIDIHYCDHCCMGDSPNEIIALIELL